MNFKVLLHRQQDYSMASNNLLSKVYFVYFITNKVETRTIIKVFLHRGEETKRSE